jgi:hypothetical protein
MRADDWTVPPHHLYSRKRRSSLRNTGGRTIVQCCLQWTERRGTASKNSWPWARSKKLLARISSRFYGRWRNNRNTLGYEWRALQVLTPWLDGKRGKEPAASRTCFSSSVQAKLRVPQPKIESGSLSERARRSCLSRNCQRQVLSRWRVRDPCERFVGFRDEEPLPGAWSWVRMVEPLCSSGNVPNSARKAFLRS